MAEAQGSHHDYVVLGGGMACASFVTAISAHLFKKNKTMGIVTDYPSGLFPYQRPEVTKSFLKNDPAARNPAGGKFPFCATGSKGLGAVTYYKKKKDQIFFFNDSTVIEVDVVNKRVRYNKEGKTGHLLTLTYDKLIIATGARSKVMPGLPPQSSVFYDKHSDLDTALSVKTDGLSKPSFGEVFTLRSVGDAAKLARSLDLLEDDDQETCFDPVVVVGGGFVALEAAATIAQAYPDLNVTVVLGGDHFLQNQGIFDGKMSAYYEKHLAQRLGVRFARNFRAVGVWPSEEEGSFCSLDGAAMDLHRTRPRLFSAPPKQFTSCRGIKVIEKDKEGAGFEPCRVPARFVIFGGGCVPNSEVFSAALLTSPSGHLVVDENCRTSPTFSVAGTEDVFAIGDVAVVQAGNRGPVVETGHVDMAQKMGAKAAQVIISSEEEAEVKMRRSKSGGGGASVGGGDAAESSALDALSITNPMSSYMSMSILDLGWKFWGTCKGTQIVTVGLTGSESISTPSTWCAFYLLEQRIVGGLIEGGTPLQQSQLRSLVLKQPKISSAKKLAKCSLDDFLSNPSLLSPAELLPGDFEAELDPEDVRSAFARYETFPGSGLISVESAGALMKDLGADWNDEERADAIRALDERGSKVIGLGAFVAWWSS